MMDPLSRVGDVQPLIEKGPQTFVAAVFCVAFFALLAIHLKAQRDNKLDQERLQTAHQKELSELHKEAKELLAKVVQALHSYLDMMADVRFLAHEGREKRARAMKRGTSIPEPEQRTQIITPGKP